MSGSAPGGAARKKNHDWLALTVEEPLEPDLPICDPHHHLWDGESARVVPRYLLDEILEDVRAGHHIVSTVSIECGAMWKTDGPEARRAVGETEFVNGIAAMSASGVYGRTRVAAGIVGTAPLRLGAAVAPVLDAQIARAVPRHPPGRGLGPGRGGSPPPHPSSAGPAPAGRFPGRVRPARAPRAHVRGLVLSPADPRRHRAGPRLPRHHDRSRFGWHERPRPPGSQELADATRPYYEHTIEKFGVDRCMFGSNFPVDAVSVSYTVLWNSFKRLAQGYSAAEKASLFHDTVARVYRLPG